MLVVSAVGLTACAHDKPAPAPSTVTVTNTVTEHPKPKVVTETLHAPMPKSCETAIADIVSLQRLLGKGEGLTTSIADLLGEMQADIASNQQLDAARIGQRILDQKSSLSGTLIDMHDGLDTLQSDYKTCKKETQND